jgi:hypothetical protein
VNASLAPLTKTEDFANDSVLGSVKSNSVDAITGNILSIHYDATVNNYTLTTSGNSQVFTSNNILPQFNQAADGPTTNNANSAVDTIAYFFDRSNPSIVLTKSYKGIIVYSSTGLNQLMLSSNTVPIVSSNSSGIADIVLSYVGFGAWLQGSVYGSTINGNLDYFTYGAYTADSAMPRSGSGTYAFTLEGRIAANKLGFLSGQGRAIADFGAGTISFNSNNVETYPDGTAFGGGAFTANAAITSNVNRFSGTFNYQGSVGPVAGTMNGRFYGPNAQEIGAVFSGKNASVAVEGAIVGSSQPGTNK